MTREEWEEYLRVRDAGDVTVILNYEAAFEDQLPEGINNVTDADATEEIMGRGWLWGTLEPLEKVIVYDAFCYQHPKVVATHNCKDGCGRYCCSECWVDYNECCILCVP